ncbi:alpha/beta fold hydrolase [Phenylobacterium immobile]|uniref:alpha/beta fold hydrolase n=1 Tax=Phenylobacterium immobile TaxID=21 RepID=UPI000B0E1108|nr:alpha/beta fold hydrolase [Phenylobacterium immobile]
MLSFEDTRRQIAAAGTVVHYNEAGDGDALICLHGGGPGANGWDNTKWVVDELSRHFHVVMLDLPGYGASPPMEALPGETNDRFYARAILAVMDALNISKAHLYGPSMGAAPMLRLAHDHPERVLKLVLKCPVGLGPNLFTPSPPDGIKALTAFRADPSYENMEQIMRLFIPREGLLTKAMIDARFASAQQAMAHPPASVAPLGTADLREAAQNLKPQTLVLWGHQDRMVPMDAALSALALIPHVELHLWGGGVGHFVEFEEPEAFLRAVIPFLKG